MERALLYKADNEMKFMRQALALARRGVGGTHPNPRVGAILVRRGSIVGQGYHHFFGGSHAEAEALSNAHGDTLYVTLEPCAHHGKTPPCTDLIVQSGIRRVVVATLDPDRRLRGKGVEILRTRGIQVDTGIFQKEARELNRPYFLHRLAGRSHLTLKLAVSADGRCAVGDGLSKWISSATSRSYVHRVRRRSDAVVVGVGTVLADDPLLTDHRLRGRQPVRIVLDQDLRIPQDARILGKDAETILVTTDGASKKQCDFFRERGIGVWVLPPTENGLICLRAFLQRTAREGLLDLLCEGGREIATSFVADGLMDRLILVQAPRLFGGYWTWLGDLGISNLKEGVELAPPQIRKMGEDIIVAWPSLASEQLIHQWNPRRKNVHRTH